MPTFSWVPSFTLDLTEEPRVLSARFGDGYEQLAADGIHPVTRKFQVQFNGRDNTEAEAILAFLRERSGWQSFDWTPPLSGEAAGKFVCRSWGRGLSRPKDNRMSLVFEERFL